MSDPDTSQTSSASVDAEGDINIGGDIVGRDKIETHQHYQQAPTEDQNWQLFYAGGLLARTLLILGTIIMVVGALGFSAVLWGSSAARSQASLPWVGSPLFRWGNHNRIGRAIASHSLHLAPRSPGGQRPCPAQAVHGITSARSEIQRLKVVLRQ